MNTKNLLSQILRTSTALCALLITAPIHADDDDHDRDHKSGFFHRLFNGPPMPEPREGAEGVPRVIEKTNTIVYSDGRPSETTHTVTYPDGTVATETTTVDPSRLVTPQPRVNPDDRIIQHVDVPISPAPAPQVMERPVVAPSSGVEPRAAQRKPARRAGPSQVEPLGNAEAPATSPIKRTSPKSATSPAPESTIDASPPAVAPSRPAPATSVGNSSAPAPRQEAMPPVKSNVDSLADMPAGVNDDKNKLLLPPNGQQDKDKNFPLATRSTKPGFVKSPFEPFNELDATGMISGSLARDPTTGKVFRVP